MILTPPKFGNLLMLILMLEASSMIVTLLKSWELGNEPNSLPHQLNFSLPAKQLGQVGHNDAFVHYHGDVSDDQDGYE